MYGSSATNHSFDLFCHRNKNYVFMFFFFNMFFDYNNKNLIVDMCVLLQKTTDFYVFVDFLNFYELMFCFWTFLSSIYGIIGSQK